MTNFFKLAKVPIEMDIQMLMSAAKLSLSSSIGIDQGDNVSQNLQSRIRVLLLTVLASNYNYKAELAVGESITEDIIHITDAHKLARWRNRNIPECGLEIKNISPENIINKHPSELSENQKDSDNLPDYDILDEILYRYVDLRYSLKEIVMDGFDSNVVSKVLNLVAAEEYKRFQSAPGPKISDMSFDLDWRYPLNNKIF